MIFGLDLVRVAQVVESMRLFGDRYLARVYTPGELSTCGRKGRTSAQRLAARFAAKEATIKVLRPAARWTDFRSIEVVRTPGGWPEIVLHGEAQELAERAGLDEFSVTITHEGAYAAAIVAAATRRRP